MHYDEVNDALFQAFPSFFEVIELDLQYYIDDYCGGQYSVAARFVDFLEDCHSKGDDETYRKGLLFIEQLHQSNWRDVRELATVGYLESFLDWSEKDKLANDLGDESKRWWLELNLFWQGKIDGIGQSFRLQQGDHIEHEGKTYEYLGKGLKATGSKTIWRLSPELYFKCWNCGYFMNGDPQTDDRCLCGILNKSSGYGRFGIKQGDNTIEVFQRV